MCYLDIPTYETVAINTSLLTSEKCTVIFDCAVYETLNYNALSVFTTTIAKTQFITQLEITYRSRMVRETDLSLNEEELGYHVKLMGERAYLVIL